MRNIYAIIIVLILAIGSMFIIFGSPDTPTGYIISGEEDFDFYLNNLNYTMEEYNANLEYVPGFVKKIFGTERINGTLTLLNGTTINIKAVTKSGKLTMLEKGSLEEPSMNLWIRQDTINRLLESENQIDDLKKALDEKEIKYEAITMKTKVKTGIARVFLKVFSWFS